MKKLFIATLTFFAFISIMTAQNNWWADLPTYEGADLGLTYTPQYADIKIWSPVAQEVTLRFYKTGTPTTDNSDLIETVKMTKGEKGTWSHHAEGNRAGQFYTVQVTTSEGKTFILNFEIPKPLVQELVLRKLAESKEKENKPNSTALVAPNNKNTSEK